MNRAVVLLASVAFAIGATASSLPAQPQQADTIDPAVPTQLPRTAVPHHYAITVTPHAERLSFDATVAIDLDVTTSTRQLVLNAADLKLASATLRPAKGGAPLPASIVTEKEAQTATLRFRRSLTPGAYRLNVRYSGKVNTQANGLFALDYKNVEGKDARALFTQFEAADARRFVPSWDEPDYKATFDLTVRVPASEMAVSNMPAAATQPIAGGLEEVRFQTSPVMSTYLLFFATGDFERIAKPAGGREVGIVMTRGNASKAQFALDAEAQILPYYNDYFGVPYALPKLDNVAGPGQSQFFGAMENWGAIFTFERILLLDPAITTEADRQLIFSVEAHEMAHQWFGDLVTMAWWDDLWLNEGFASWMEGRTTRHFHPDWGADVDQVASREAAMNLDSFAATHPIVQNVRTVEQANQAFDAITYQKGETVISMLEGFVGSDVWQRGVQAYIRRFAYRNTRTSDLWTAIEQAGGTGLTRVADDFTKQPGIPLISAAPAQCLNGRTVTTLTQSQFSLDRREQAATSPLSWHVPVRASAGGAATQVVTDGRATPLTVEGCGPLVLNVGQTGYYRTLYAAPQAEALRSVFPRLGAVDQYGLMQDALAMSRGGYQPMARALDLVDAVPASANGKVVERAANNWSALYDDFEGDAATQAAIARRMSRLYGPRLQALGFVPRAGEPAIDALLRTTLIKRLGHVGDPVVVAEANRLFQAWLRDPNAIPGALKEAWLGVVAENATPASWDALREAARSTQGQVERSTLYQLLGEAKDEALARRALELAITPEPGKTISAGMITSVAETHHPGLALDFVLSNQKQVDPLVDLSGRSRFVAGLVQQSADEAAVPKLEAYGTATFGPDDRKPIERAITRIRWRAANLPRIQAETRQWLAAHPMTKG